MCKYLRFFSCLISGILIFIFEKKSSYYKSPHISADGVLYEPPWPPPPPHPAIANVFTRVLNLFKYVFMQFLYRSKNLFLLKICYFDFHDKYHILQITSNWRIWGPVRTNLVPPSENFNVFKGVQIFFTYVRPDYLRFWKICISARKNHIFGQKSEWKLFSIGAKNICNWGGQIFPIFCIGGSNQQKSDQKIGILAKNGQKSELYRLNQYISHVWYMPMFYAIPVDI